ncbi:MAG: DUF262 domain-containing protein [Spirochaetaceae bacterium]|nr:DUF262 domain-containing protein [Spirochaetaceae bacterium]
MGLSDEINQRRAEISSDGYSMSVGELISMYENGELNIRPQFQRFFRWTPYQRSRLIESLLLKIPIPSIFVSQRQDGVWDVIDGQQRLSTILQLVGILKDADGNRLDPLKLAKTKFLPSLLDKTWSGTDCSGIGRDNQLLIKRSKIDVKIILRESSEASKYELFQRLNSGGSPLSEQEMRNVIMIMVNPSFYEWMETLALDENFLLCTALSDRAREERYDLELITRFLALRKRPNSRLHIDDLGNFLDDEAERFAGDESFDTTEEQAVFTTTFGLLAAHYGDDIFRRYDRTKKRHLGGFLISAFEVFAIGLGSRINSTDASLDSTQLKKVVRNTWSDPDFIDNVGSGISASRRIPVVIPYARRRLAKCLSAPSRS